ncbi:hypothetical protein [Streptomyces sp. NPDC002851]
MPRPTVAQLAYGTATVVFATLALLLLARTQSAIGIALVAVAALGLGLLVAVTLPAPRTVRTPRTKEIPLDASPAPARTEERVPAVK